MRITLLVDRSKWREEFARRCRIFVRGREVSDRVDASAARVLKHAVPGDRVELPIFLERNGSKFVSRDQKACTCAYKLRKRGATRVARAVLLDRIKRQPKSFFHVLCPARHEVAIASVSATVEAIEYTEAAA